MKKKLLNISVCLLSLSAISASAQWCVPTTITPYNQNMPGITHVVIGNIDRTSADLENYPYNSYVNTGLSTDLIPGNTYSISITHTIDASICPDMNIRVWVDYNLDYSFDDAGENVVSANNHLPGTYTGTFTVPLTAAPGITQMRVTAKMSPAGGHTLPTPCDFPPDPLGYHGEIEDYTVNIINTTGIYTPSINLFQLAVYPSPIYSHATISFEMKSHSENSISLHNSLGESVWISNVKSTSAGKQEIFLDEKTINNLSPGVYFIQLTGDGKKQVKRLIIL
jgi:hypothetical protein